MSIQSFNPIILQMLTEVQHNHPAQKEILQTLPTHWHIPLESPKMKHLTVL
jgi:hypothetical protein